MSLNHERLFTNALRAWFLLKMAAKCTELNLLRAASIRASVPGPYTIPAGAVLQLSTTGTPSGSMTQYPLTSGSRTAAQLVAELAGVSSDDSGTLVLTSPTPPAAPSTLSILAVGPDNLGTDGAATGVNAALGFGAGGEVVRSSPLIWSGTKAVSVGWPVTPDFPAGINIVIGDTEAAPSGSIRRDTYDVSTELTVMQVERNGANHRNNEHMHAVVQAVREVFQTDAGRQLGRGGINDIALVEEVQTRIAAVPFEFKVNGKSTNLLFDAALMKLRARVVLIPAAT